MTRTIPAFELSSTNGLTRVRARLLSITTRRQSRLAAVCISLRDTPGGLGVPCRAASRCRVLLALARLSRLRDAILRVCRSPDGRGLFRASAGASRWDRFDVRLDPNPLSSIRGSFSCRIAMVASRTRLAVTFTTDLTCLDHLACSLDSFIKESNMRTSA